MKTKLPWILLIIAVLLAYFFYQKIEKVQRQQSILSEDSIRYWRNKAGDAVAERNAVEANAKELKQFYAKEAETIRKDFDTKLGDLRRYLSAEIQTAGEGVVTTKDTIYVSDTVRIEGKTFSIREPYFYFDGLLSGGQLQYQYSVRDSLTFVSKVRTPLFGKREVTVMAKSANEKTTFLNLREINIPVSRKRFGLGVGLGYAPFDSKVFPVVYVGYNIIEF